MTDTVPDDARLRAGEPPPAPLSAREHHHLAKALIDACGGVHEIIRQSPALCRVGRSELYRYAEGSTFMPADVVADLEAYAGEPIYSRVLVERRPARPDVACPRETVLDKAQLALSLQAVVRRILSDGVVTPREREEAEQLLGELDRLTAQLRRGLDDRMAAPPKPAGQGAWPRVAS